MNATEIAYVGIVTDISPIAKIPSQSKIIEASGIVDPVKALLAVY